MSNLNTMTDAARREMMIILSVAISRLAWTYTFSGIVSPLLKIRHQVEIVGFNKAFATTHPDVN